MKTTTEQHTRKDNKPRLQHTCTEKKENTHMLLLGTSETTGSHRCYCFFTSHMNRVPIATSFTAPQIGQAVRSTTHGLQAQRCSHGSNIIQAPPELQTIQVRSVLVDSACHTWCFISRAWNMWVHFLLQRSNHSDKCLVRFIYSNNMLQQLIPSMPRSFFILSDPLQL